MCMKMPIISASKRIQRKDYIRSEKKGERGKMPSQ